MKKLLKEIEQLEQLILIYSDRDRERVKVLEAQLERLNEHVLDRLANDTSISL